MKNNHLSKVGKLDGIMSWSMPAIKTCPGAYDDDGALCAACSGCYATCGHYNFPCVKNARAENMEAWKDPEWVPTMVKKLKNEHYFRWFDSGDMYNIRLVEKMLDIMEQTSNVNHWLPSRMWKFKSFNSIIKKMNDLSNVNVRFSSDNIDGTFTKGVHGAVIVPYAEMELDGVCICPATKSAGKCNGCRACWDKDVGVIGYVAHGYKMKKLIAS